MRYKDRPPGDDGEARARRRAAARRRAVGRRRLAALGAGALVALIAGIAAGAGDDAGGDGEPAAAETPQQQRLAAAREAVDRLALRQQVGQVTISSFPGTARPEYIRRRLRARETAGVILFGSNGGDRAAWRRLTRSLQQAGHGRALIMVDQEGGDIRILPWAPPAASQAQQAAAGTVATDAEAAARALRATGINVSLAPVGDVPSVDGAALAGRAFSTDFQAAAEAMAESVRGWRKGGVAPTAKHFPGIGGAVTNTDDGSATIERSAQQIRDEDLVPFRAAIEAGVPLVMAGHALYPALDGERIASQSQPIIDGILRDELGFDGVVITDSTEAAAVQAVTGVQEAAVRNIRAGVDIVLTTGRGSYIQVYRALLAEARRDPAFRERVKQSAERVVALQQSLR
jgi:beta-N-acetylhexosaminidase